MVVSLNRSKIFLGGQDILEYNRDAHQNPNIRQNRYGTIRIVAPPQNVKQNLARNLIDFLKEKGFANFFEMCYTWRIQFPKRRRKRCTARVFLCYSVFSATCSGVGKGSRTYDSAGTLVGACVG